MKPYVHVLNNKKLPGDLLELVEDDDGATTYWIMAPKPGYQVPFDVSKDELVIL